MNAFRANQFARQIEATRPEPFGGSLGEHLEAMIAIQMTAYPADWDEADKRELAERHLRITETEHA